MDGLNMGVGIMRDKTLKRRDLNVSHTLGRTGGNNSKSCIGSSGHVGGTRTGQTRKLITLPPEVGRNRSVSR